MLIAPMELRCGDTDSFVQCVSGVSVTPSEPTAYTAGTRIPPGAGSGGTPGSTVGRPNRAADSMPIARTVCGPSATATTGSPNACRVGIPRPASEISCPPIGGGVPVVYPSVNGSTVSPVPNNVACDPAGGPD